MTLGVGIDLGASDVTCAAVRRRGGSLRLEWLLHVSHEELAADGVDPTSPLALARALQARAAARGQRLGRAVIGISGRDAIIRYSSLPPMPDWRLALLMELEVQDMSEKTGEALSADHRVLPSQGDETLVLVALAKDARVQETVDAFEAAGVEVVGATPQPLAVADCFRFLGETPDAGTVLTVDVGPASSEVAVVEMGELLFARSVALGASSGTGQLTSVVTASLDYARGQLRRKRLQPDRVVVTGAGARDEALVAALGKALGCPAARFDPLRHLDDAAADRDSRALAEERGLEAATAVGLALSAAVPGATRLDLLPRAVKERRQFRDRTLWMWVSGAVVAAALLVATGTALVARSGQRDRAAALGRARGEVQQRLTDHEARTAKNDAREAELRALADRARPGFHLSALLERLGAVTPARVSLTEMRLVREEGEVRFELRGVADNSQADGLEAMAALERALAADRRVARAKVRPQTTQGQALEFELTVVAAGAEGAPAGDAGPGAGEGR